MSAPDSPQEWHEWRASGLGASDIAKAATGRYGGAVSVVADKIGLKVDSEEIAPDRAERFDRGHRWEQPIADAVLATHGLYVHGEQLWMTHPEVAWHLATIDGFLHPDAYDVPMHAIDALLEVKTRGRAARSAWDYYRAQVQWQMHVTGMGRALVAVATIDDTDDRITRLDFEWVERDPYVIDQLVVLADRLWVHVQAGTLPDPEDGSALPIIKAANATANPMAVAELDGIEQVIADYADLRERAKAAADELKLAEARIRVAMGEATEAVTTSKRWRVRVGEPVHKFTSDAGADALDLYPQFGRTVLDRQRFKDEMPEMYEALRRPTADRRMTIKELWK